VVDQIMFEVAALVPPAYRGVYANPPAVADAALLSPDRSPASG
jgi:hypothetical protein